jgi:5-methylcytosine-specific restriction protein A
MPWRPVAPRRPDTRPSAAARGYGHAWTKQRAKQLRDFPYCAFCGVAATEVHHILARRHGGQDDPSNYLSACKPCHSKITRRGG